jgi:hypothetical protein
MSETTTTEAPPSTDEKEDFTVSNVVSGEANVVSDYFDKVQPT